MDQESVKKMFADSVKEMSSKDEAMADRVIKVCHSLEWDEKRVAKAIIRRNSLLTSLGANFIDETFA